MSDLALQQAIDTTWAYLGKIVGQERQLAFEHLKALLEEQKRRIKKEINQCM